MSPTTTLLPPQPSTPIAAAQDVAALFYEKWADLQQEHFWVVSLNTKRYVTHIDLVSIGTLDGALVHPRDIFRYAISHNASAIILVHNHPSGDPTPSTEDDAVTRAFVKAGHILGIPVLDHIIIGDHRHHSIK